MCKTNHVKKTPGLRGLGQRNQSSRVAVCINLIFVKALWNCQEEILALGTVSTP